MDAIIERMLQNIKEIFGFSLQEKIFTLSAMFCGFLISTDYAIVRPVSNSLFIHFYGSEAFPYAWLAGVPISFLAVALYNRYLARIGCLKMFFLVASIVVSVNLTCAFFVNKMQGFAFLFYVWKEIYIMLMFQQIWSVIHSTITHERAKYLYGILFGCGALGGITGSLIPGFFAVKIGSESLLFATLPVYLLLAFFFSQLIKNGKEISFEKKVDIFQGIKILFHSRLLLFIMLIVVLMQFVSTLVDYQFHLSLQSTFPDKDLRTEYAGKVFSLIHALTLALQFVGTYLLLKVMGLKRAHLFVPLVLALGNIGYLIFPLFGVITLSYMMCKSFDFSIFGVVKEMLYIPMRPEEKFHAKAVVDVFAYRSAKALTSFLILFLNPVLLTWANILLFAIWCIIVVKMMQPEAAHEQIKG
jgi:AAA family ATP:ADP antiporter